MINTTELKTFEDFKQLKKGDIVACEFHRNMNQGIKLTFRFKVFEVVENKQTTDEIILNKKFNNYFNYKMFTDGDSGSNLKSATLITSL